MTTAVHICFGYAAIIHERPSGYSFLPELAAAPVDQISIEAAQPRLDLGVLKSFPRQTIMLGVLDLGDPAVETPAEAGQVKFGQVIGENGFQVMAYDVPAGPG